MGAVNFAFVDGHAKGYEIKPINDRWFAAGGSVPGEAPYTEGEHSYTYPPGLGATPSEAEWWTAPWYPGAPLNYRR